jgi:hypothetical protein
MNWSLLIAKHLREVHLGGNWTGSNLKSHLEDVSWVEATTKIDSFNTIATLVFHIGYYVTVILQVLNKQPLNAKDEFSFNHPPINSEEDWQKLLSNSTSEAEQLMVLIEKLSDDELISTFADVKYGNYYRNLHGLIEHTHYHLGQIAILKKIIKGKHQ